MATAVTIGWGGTVSDWLDDPRALLTAVELIDEINRKARR
jgi:hypothetical protein